MDSRSLAVGIMLLSQSTVGILGNLSLLSKYVVLYYSECTLKPTDLILTHLVVANFLTILFKGVPQTMAVLGMKQFFNDLGCKILLYIQRVGRSMSISTTCLLSVFQAITISPRSSCWKNLKDKGPKYIGPLISLFWIQYLAINFVFPLYIHIKVSNNNKTEKRDFESCSSRGRDKILDSLYAALFVFPEVLFSVLITWSSGCMVVTLHRHARRVQHIHSSQASLRTSPESRATRSILNLVSTFLAFYTLSSILHGYVAFLDVPSWWLVNTTAFISMCFPTLAPFVMRHDFTLPRFCLPSKCNTKFQNLIIAMQTVCSLHSI